VTVVPSTAEASPVAERPPPRAGAGASWLIAGCYLLGALVVTGRLWADPAGRMPAGNAKDVDFFAWCLRYSATAVAHGHLPALEARQGHTRPSSQRGRRMKNAHCVADVPSIDAHFLGENPALFRYALAR
jgi:hypothetical protein